MSEQALSKLEYICLESGLMQSKAISVDKASLAEIYKTPSASPLPFPHPPWAGATTDAFPYPPAPRTCPGRKLIPLPASATYPGAVRPRTARNTFSLQTPLLTCAVNKHFAMNTPTTEVRN